MLDQLLKQLQTQVKSTSNLPEETRVELLKQAALLETRQAKDEVEAEDAEPNQAREGVDRLIASIEGLEASHPQITSLVNRIAMTLGNMGI
jgi:hypothetical protein